MTTATAALKRLLVGRPLRSEQMPETLLPKWLALPIFSSDALSSVAYATEEILLYLGAGGAGYLIFTKWVAGMIAVLLAIVVLSYRQTCYAYPGGGGSYAVSLDNFGPNAALTAAAALLVDYVMTVAVSVVAGVVAITSAFPSLSSHSVLLSATAVILLLLVNLRGIKESGRAFAIPTYSFVVLTLLLVTLGVIKLATGDLPTASGAALPLARSEQVGGIWTVFLVARAFASGCTALTGIEAVSNGVPAFRPPKSRNAATTLALMGLIALVMFGGITVLAIRMDAHAYPSGNPSVISQLAAGVYGSHAPLFYLFQAATAAILVLAANTAFNGFPVLASILARDSYLPRQLRNRGDKLVFSNGMILLAGFAIALIVGFSANIDKLIQLYIIGVFTAFTLSQFGMVRHWSRILARGGHETSERNIRAARIINLVGGCATTLVLIVVIATKFTKGAWLAMVAMTVLFFLMKGIRRHYDQVAKELDVTSRDRPLLPARNVAVILVSKVHLPTLRAIAYAKGTRPHTLQAVTVMVDPDETRQLEQRWLEQVPDVPLVVLDSPYRDVTRPLLEYLRRLREHGPRDVITVFIPEYVVGRWWEQLLHNQSALRLKARLLFEPGVMVTSVPWQLQSAEASPLAPPPLVTRT